MDDVLLSVCPFGLYLSDLLGLHEVVFHVAFSNNAITFLQLTLLCFPLIYPLLACFPRIGSLIYYLMIEQLHKVSFVQILFPLP